MPRPSKVFRRAVPPTAEVMVPKFLIEVPHAPDTGACLRVVQVFLSTGSHFLTNAEWGCQDGVHSAWMIVEVATKAEALGIVPQMYRHEAKIVGLNRFSMAAIEPILKKHPALRVEAADRS